MRRVLGSLFMIAWFLSFVGCGGGSGTPVADASKASPPPPAAPAAPAAPPADTTTAPAGSADAAATPGVAPGMIDPNKGDAAGISSQPLDPTAGGYSASDPSRAGPLQPASSAPPMPGDVFAPPYRAAGTGLPGDSAGINPDGSIPGAAPLKPLTLDGMGRLAFERGREREGLNCFYAWALTTDAGASEILSQYQWVAGLKHPAIAVRWGVGLEISPPKFAGDPKPIGTDQGLVVGFQKREGREGREGGNRRNAAPSDGAGAQGVPGGNEGQGIGRNQLLARYIGEFGDKVLAEFQTRVGNGNFGKILSETSVSPSAGGNNPADGFAGAGAGQFGDGGRSGMPGAAGGQARPGAAPSAQAISPGLTMLGIGTEKDLLEKAKKEGIDVLALVRVKLSTNVKGIVINESTMDFVDVALAKKDPKALKEGMVGTKPLENTEVERLRKQNKDDGLDKEVKKLFDFVDQKLVMSALPQFPPGIVKTRRVDVLLSEPHDNPLPILAEIKFYHRNKLLSDEETTAAFGKLLGSDTDGATLLNGSEEERKTVLQRWLPKS